MSEEKIRILKMLEEGKINSEQAERLLSAVGETYIEDKEDDLVPHGKAKWLKIRVFEEDMEKPKDIVNVPLKLAKIAVRLGTKFTNFIPADAKEEMAKNGVTPDMLNDLDKLDELIDGISEAGPFKLVDVDDEENGNKVQITIE